MHGLGTRRTEPKMAALHAPPPPAASPAPTELGERAPPPPPPAEGDALRSALHSGGTVSTKSHRAGGAGPCEKSARTTAPLRGAAAQA